MPDCKHCDCHEYVAFRAGGGIPDYRERGHWCESAIRYGTDEYSGVLWSSFPIDTKQYHSKTPPERCPKICDFVTVNKQQEPILEVRSRVGISRRHG